MFGATPVATAGKGETCTWKRHLFFTYYISMMVYFQGTNDTTCPRQYEYGTHVATRGEGRGGGREKEGKKGPSGTKEKESLTNVPS